MLLIDSQYFVSISEIKYLNNKESIFVDISGFYKKHTFSNRMFLVGSQGLIDLSIPIIGGRGKKQLLIDVIIDYRTKWHIKHWRTIESCYRRSPWYEFYEADLKKLYVQEFESLWNWNFEILQWIINKLGYSCSVNPYFGNELLNSNYHNITLNCTPKNYIQKWNEKGLKSYTQVFEDKIGFYPNLSVLDLLFCVGPQSISYLQ